MCIICDGKGTIKIQALDVIDEVNRLGKLRKKGHITDKEFEIKKKKLLNL